MAQPPTPSRAGPPPPSPVAARIPLPLDRIAAFCRKWGVAEFALFGSVLRDDFSPDSDVDVLVTFAPNAEGITFENRPDILDELSGIFGGRKVDLVEKDLITNPFRRYSILTTARVLYAA